MKTKDETTRSKRDLRLQDYFDGLEEMVVKKLHQEVQTKQGRAELIRSTGVEDPNLIAELTHLGITADGLIALRLFPLAMVAWAEDLVDKEERETVLAEALRLGIREDTTAWILLDHWLRKPLPGLGVDAWRRYTHGIFSKMSPIAVKRLVKLTRKQMEAVAKASGGHFGFGKVSKKEQLLIERLTETMLHELNDHPN